MKCDKSSESRSSQILSHASILWWVYCGVVGILWCGGYIVVGMTVGQKFVEI